MEQFKDKNILVTGGCGVIGRELIAKLVLFGANVRCVDFVDLPTELEKLDPPPLILTESYTDVLLIKEDPK